MATIPPWKALVNTELFNNPTVAEALSPEAVELSCRESNHKWRQSFWSPATTVMAFFLQVLSAEKTLRAAVTAVLVQLAARGELDLPSCDPTAYCQARKRLPIEVLKSMLNRTVEGMRDLVTPSTGWLGRRTWVADGSSVSMSDTPELQAAFPQPSGQKPGCGFPVAQIVSLFCWTTGAIIDLAIDTIRPHEVSLFRGLWHHFQRGDVVLADRAYGSYVDLARLQGRGVYGVFRLHQKRKADFRKGKRLGKDDRLMTWDRPDRWVPSVGVSRRDFETLPETLQVRLIRITVGSRGFRSQTINVVTTLLDPVETPADEIRALYRDRWTVELNLRSLKTHLGMDILRGQDEDVVRKEIAMHLLMYNLIRLIMWQAARRHGRDLHRLSFTGTLHRLRPVFALLMQATGRPSAIALVAHLLRCVARDMLPHRPDRVEPRRVKRRPKPYSLLTKPRAYYRRHGDPDAR